MSYPEPIFAPAGQRAFVYIDSVDLKAVENYSRRNRISKAFAAAYPNAEIDKDLLLP
ncbi:MAG: hypothetical protein IPP17_06695 [Bacteroidetes bacterium]|nr:hypothetical protein [Bacteroidota bacterium]